MSRWESHRDRGQVWHGDQPPLRHPSDLILTNISMISTQDIKIYTLYRCSSVHISEAVAHCAGWMNGLIWPGGVTLTVNKQGLSSQEKSVRMIIMNYDISSQSCQFLFSLFYRQHQFVFNVWLIEASVPKQSPSTRCSVTRRGCVGLIWNKVTFTTSFV